ncbi:ribosomal protection-like ABC-F family protein [Alkaliphilus transvaalensis]|uniref:ribosomal protection-like ABC-F family protein n=1 Tax=Alkaliphilus transvaalensis TaxID=114628 RepID=UPI00047B9C19|nr:ABC-F type ribosomal protection protein [Alkaliphilus transvaalensis]
MIILSCNQLTKYFGIDLILRDITFSVQKGEKVGLVGANGAGKSTLFNILCGKLPFDEGDLFISKSTVLGYLEQSTVMSEDTNVYDEALTIFSHLIQMEENLRSLEVKISEVGKDSSQSKELAQLMDEYAALTEKFEKNNGYGFRSEVKGVLKGLGFADDDLLQPVIQLSGGEKTRLGLAKLLLSKPDILLLDEPTNHLDIQAVEWLEGFLRDYSGTVLMISHDRYFLDQIVTHILEIENHEITSYNGNYSAFVEKKRVIQEQQLRNYQNQQKEIDRQEDVIRRLKQHGTEKLMKRAKSKEKQLDKVDRLDKPQTHQKRAKIRFETQIKSGNDVLAVKEVAKSFDSSPLFRDLAFDIYRGERVALIGPNGIGKSTLMKIILNELPLSAGEIQLGHNVLPAYYDQEQKSLNMDKTIIDEIWDLLPNKTQTEIRSLLGSFLFQDEEVFKPIAPLSGGEKARLSLLKLLISKANFLLLDEPTNHLDILAKEVLEEALVNYDGTVLVISHDRYFLNRIATKVIELSPNGCETFLGNYDYYLYKKKQQEFDNIDEPIEEKTKTQIKEEKRKEKEEKNKQKELVKKRKKIEEDIINYEEEASQLEDLLCQEEVYSNPDKSKEVQYQLTNVRDKINELYEEWENVIDISS